MSQDYLTPDEWACWVLLDDPNARMSQTLEEVAKRIAQAVRQATLEFSKVKVAEERKACAKKYVFDMTFTKLVEEAYEPIREEVPWSEIRHQENLERIASAIRQAVAEERKACIKDVEEWFGKAVKEDDTPDQIIAAIRDRGKQ